MGLRIMSEISINPAFINSPKIKEIYKLFDHVRSLRNVAGIPSCVLVSGDSGSGKSELAKRYLEKHERYDTEDRTVIPVVYCELKSVSSSKDLAQQILRSISDPQNGQGVKGRDLIERFSILSKTAKTELLIIDEVQTAIERRSQRVVSGIADWIKDLSNDSRVPIVLIGMPWSIHLVKSNPQLERRTRYKRQLLPFKVTNNFNEYRKLLAMLGKYYGVSNGFLLEERSCALRLFSFTSGNLGRTSSLILEAHVNASMSGELLSLSELSKAVSLYGCPDSENPFLLDITDLLIREVVNESTWDFNARRKDDSLKSPEYLEYGVSKDLKIIQIGKR